MAQTQAADKANSFIADESFSRDVADLAEAVDAANVTYFPIGVVLDALQDVDSLDEDALSERTELGADELVDGLRRMQDLGLLSYRTAPATTDGSGREVALTAEGRHAARHRERD